MAGLKLLVVDGNTRAVNARHQACGGRPGGEYYLEVLRGLRTDVEGWIVRPADADGDRLPAGMGLADFDGVAWGGSALNVYNDVPEVSRQVELARATFRAGIPMFGSCWGLQVATVAAGGVVRPNPKGREIGIARRIMPTAAGAEHPLYAGKSGPFDAVAVHMDEVATAPAGMTVLAGNAMSVVQAAELRHQTGVCWGVQYHPEYDLAEIAAVMARYRQVLVDDGFAADPAVLDRLVVDFRTLAAQPRRKDLAWLYGLDATVLEPALRLAEIANWLTHVVQPTAAARR